MSFANAQMVLTHSAGFHPALYSKRLDSTVLPSRSDSTFTGNGIGRPFETRFSFDNDYGNIIDNIFDNIYDNIYDNIIDNMYYFPPCTTSSSSSRDWMPSLRYMLRTCVRTVFSETPSSPATYA